MALRGRRRCRWAAAGLLCAALMGGCAPKGPQRPPVLEAAHRRVTERPGDGDAYLDLARLYFEQKDPLRARQYLEVAERLPVRDEAERLRLALAITVRLGLYDDAVTRIRAQLDRREDPQLRLLLASLFEGMGRFRDAELEHRLVLEARPKDSHLLVVTARFYQRWRAADLARSGQRRDRDGTIPADPRAADLLRRYLMMDPSGAEAPQARAALRAMELQGSLRGAGDGDNATAAVKTAAGRQP